MGFLSFLKFWGNKKKETTPVEAVNPDSDYTPIGYNDHQEVISIPTTGLKPEEATKIIEQRLSEIAEEKKTKAKPKAKAEVKVDPKVEKKVTAKDIKSKVRKTPDVTKPATKKPIVKKPVIKSDKK